MRFLHLSFLLFLFPPAARAQAAYPLSKYENFDVAVYVRAYEVVKMKDPAWLREHWEPIEQQVHVDKVYLEVYRDELVPDRSVLEQARAYFAARGIRTAAGLALVRNERNRFQTFSYTDPAQRQRVRSVVELAASVFDELILDDFFFTNTKTESDIAAKGDRTWSEFRLQLMAEAARELVVEPARAINPGIKLVIKYPNWYEHFQGCGYNLAEQPPLFSGLYTGTETRDPVFSQQHLQQYLGYNIFRYFENIAPGRNLGGWVDTGGMRYTDRYAEQLWITLFARAPEVTLFALNELQRPNQDAQRAPWQGQGTSFDFDRMRQEPIVLSDGRKVAATTVARAAGQVFSNVDRFLGQLGQPVGLASYKPFHSTGEDFLHNFLGMIGLPIDLRPAFPADAGSMLLTASAAADPEIVKKIEHAVRGGGTVVITSGLLRRLQGRGLDQIATLEATDHKAVVRRFSTGWRTYHDGEVGVAIPEIRYLTNDSWELVGGITETGMGYPLLTQSSYGGGRLMVLAIPDNFSDLYALPAPVLSRLRELVAPDLYVRFEGPAQVSLFVYDNDAFIVESFRDEPVELQLVTDPRIAKLRDLQTDESFDGEERPEGPGTGAGTHMVFKVTVKPHSFRVFSGR